MEGLELQRRVVTIYTSLSELRLFTGPASGRAEEDGRLGTQHLCKTVDLVRVDLSSGSYKA